MAQYQDDRHWRVKYRPYMLAVVVALVTTMLVAPEKVEGGSMEPTLSEGQIVVMTKTSYSQKRGSPALNQVVIMKNNVGGELYTDISLAELVRFQVKK